MIIRLARIPLNGILSYRIIVKLMLKHLQNLIFQVLHIARSKRHSVGHHSLPLGEGWGEAFYKFWNTSDICAQYRCTQALRFYHSQRIVLAPVCREHHKARLLKNRHKPPPFHQALKLDMRSVLICFFHFWKQLTITNHYQFLVKLGSRLT